MDHKSGIPSKQAATKGIVGRGFSRDIQGRDKRALAPEPLRESVKLVYASRVRASTVKELLRTFLLRW